MDEEVEGYEDPDDVEGEVGEGVVKGDAENGTGPAEDGEVVEGVAGSGVGEAEKADEGGEGEADKVHGVDHEAEDLLKEGPDGEGDDLAPEGEFSKAAGEGAIGILNA